MEMLLLKHILFGLFILLAIIGFYHSFSWIGVVICMLIAIFVAKKMKFKFKRQKKSKLRVIKGGKR